MDIITLDCETDPFEHGVHVKPFAWGMYDGKNFTSIWGKKSTEKVVEILEKRTEPALIYMHNGGRFDVFYLYKWLAPERKIIGGRIVQVNLGKHEIRDSYSIVPLPLREFLKDEIDYNKFREECRDQHRDEILSYLRTDCVSLYDVVTAFRAEFGDYLTIASAAMNQLVKRHPYKRQNSRTDEQLRERFFYGGRVECFTKAGIHDVDYQIIDVNSMYPSVMRNVLHPNDGMVIGQDADSAKTAFIVAEGKQIGKIGTFPSKTKKGLDFNVPEGIFTFTSHEWKQAQKYGTFKCKKIKLTIGFENWICFDEFVDHFYHARKKAKRDGNKMYSNFYKLILNSAYGKFAQNPESFADWAVVPWDQVMPEPWAPYHLTEHGKVPYNVWSKPSKSRTYYNVAVGASITGAARAVLFDGLMQSEGLLYCDTDSIIAKRSRVKLDETELGAWKHEGVGDKFVAVGKKTYACFKNGACIKKAAKGARITADEIVQVAEGGTVEYKNMAPTFRANGTVDFIKRRIRNTIAS